MLPQCSVPLAACTADAPGQHVEVGAQGPSSGQHAAADAQGLSSNMGGPSTSKGVEKVEEELSPDALFAMKLQMDEDAALAAQLAAEMQPAPPSRAAQRGALRGGGITTGAQPTVRATIARCGA